MVSVVVWLALIVWLGLVIWALSVVRAAAVADAPPPTPDRLAAGRVPFAGRRRAMAVTQAVLLAGALGAAGYLSTAKALTASATPCRRLTCASPTVTSCCRWRWFGTVWMFW